MPCSASPVGVRAAISCRCTSRSADPINSTSAPSERLFAFTERYLGDLDFNSGDPTAALVHYQAGLMAFPADVFCLEGRARANAALGNVDEAVRDYGEVIERAPEPSFVLAYGEYLESLERCLHLPLPAAFRVDD